MKKIVATYIICLLTFISNAQVQLYGLTENGGNSDSGVIFEWQPATNTYTKKIDFNGAGMGGYPIGSLIQKGNKFYSETSVGGAAGAGTIFEWDPSTNIYTKKIDFDVTNGTQPRGSLTLNGSKFYGMTLVGGATNGGVIFEWDPATNIYTKKIDFDFGLGGYNPYGSLTFAGGKFYGMTAYGGDNDAGIIFEWDPATNIFTKKIDFGFGGGGYNPWGSLTFTGGKFYGMTKQGGLLNNGVIFEWDPATNIYTKKIDLNNANGRFPLGSLILNGTIFYGMTGYGGIFGGGIIFDWNPATNICTKKIDLTSANGITPYGNLVVFNNSVLPIHLISFSASIQNCNNTKLQWQIANAEDDCKYELLRCTDGYGFLPINLQNGNAAVTQFNYLDNALPNSTYYYRLKITDKDGKVTYSNIAIVKVGSKDRSVSIYPNPVQRGESLQLSLRNITASKIEIINAVGQVVYSSTTKQTGSISISISSLLAAGRYLVRVVSADKVDVQKILIQ